MLDATVLVARIALAGVFALAGVTKLVDLRGWRQALSGFGVPARLVPALAVALPLAELGVAALLLTSGGARLGALAAAALLLAFCGAIAANLARDRRPDCHCFGQLHSAPAGWTTLARNAALVAGAALLAVATWSGDAPSAFGWVGRLEAAELLVVCVAAALVVVTVAGTWAFLQLLQQHGRLLIRLERAEAALSGLGVDLGDASAGLGLPVGSEAPAFALEDTAGRTMRFAELVASGRPLALVFLDPGCGACRELVPEIARWQREHSGELTVAVVSGGDADAVRAEAREHGLERVLLDEQGAVSSAYAVAGTPSAVLLDPAGRVASAGSACPSPPRPSPTPRRPSAS